MHVMLELEGEEFDLYLVRDGDSVRVEAGGETFDVKVSDGGIITIGAHQFHVQLAQDSVTIDGRDAPFRITDFQNAGAPGAHGGGHKAAKVKPPMPGKIVAVNVHEGQEVKAGEILVVLEAMKMQNEIPAPGAGTVKKVHVKPGQNVEAKDVLIELE